MKHLALRLGAPALVLFLAACGGGGDDAGPTTPVSTALPASTAEAACGLANFDTELVRLVNEHRAAGANCGDRGNFAATTPLAWNARLMAASFAHSRDMAQNNHFSHTGTDNSTPSQRVSAAGYDWSTTGENIAAGQPTIAAVVAAWMGSPGHCANIMNPAFRDFGVACATSASSTYRIYWTMELAAPR
jgi:uncharacterized protein YkwD